MKALKSFTTTLLQLAEHFHELMIPTEATHWTIEGKNMRFWYITDVREDGTYPCHPIGEGGYPCYPKYIDQDTRITIHFKTEDE